MVHSGCAITLQVLGHRSASGGLPPNLYPAAGTGSAAAVPEGQGDGQTSKVNPGTFQQSRLSAKGLEMFSFLRQTLQGHRRSPGGCLFFPAVPREAAHEHINNGLLQRSWNPISEKYALGVICSALLGGDPPSISTGTFLLSSRDLHLFTLKPNAPSVKISSPAE